MVTTLPELLEAFRSRLRSQLQQVEGAHVHRKLGSLADAPAQQQRRGVALSVPTTTATDPFFRGTMEEVEDTLVVETSYRVGVKQQRGEKAALDFEQLVHASLMEDWTGKPCNFIGFVDVERTVQGDMLLSTATFRVLRLRSKVTS